MPADAAIPFEMLEPLDLTEREREALGAGRCPECRSALVVLDTWERTCGCGYSFNYYTWPWATAELPEGEF